MFLLLFDYNIYKGNSSCYQLKHIHCVSLCLECHVLKHGVEQRHREDL